MSSKNTLRTLKDIEIKKIPIKWTIPGLGKYHDGIGEYIEIDDLKAEAMKWVKELQESMPSGRIFNGRRSEIITHNRTGAKIQVLKEFFNITEDDLTMKGGNEDDTKRNM